MVGHSEGNFLSELSHQLTRNGVRGNQTSRMILRRPLTGGADNDNRRKLDGRTGTERCLRSRLRDRRSRVPLSYRGAMAGIRRTIGRFSLALRRDYLPGETLCLIARLSLRGTITTSPSTLPKACGATPIFSIGTTTPSPSRFIPA